MATGGIPIQRGQTSEPRLQGGPRSNRTRTAMDVNFRLNQWKPSSMFADGPFDKPKKSKNKEKPKSGQQPGLMSPSNSDNDTRRHTPATFPRTRYTASTKERAALESLRQQLFLEDMDELSGNQRLGPTAINNVRQQSGARQAEAALPEESFNYLGARHDSLKSAGEDNHVNNELQPDRNQIVGRLMQIRDYMRQATSMMTNLQRVSDGAGRDENIDKLKRLQDHLGDQEKGYMDLLQRMLAEDATLKGGRSSNNSGESFATSAAESMSLNIDGQSDISEATTEGTFTARTRPRIESTLGKASSDIEFDSESEQNLSARSDFSRSSHGSMSGASDTGGRFSDSHLSMDTLELHRQFSDMLKSYEDMSSEKNEMGKLCFKKAGSQPSGVSSGGMRDAGSQTESEAEDVGAYDEGNPNVSEQMEELASLKQQHDLLKKMLQQQEELRALQSRQQTLLRFQAQIEGKLLKTEQENNDDGDAVSQATTTDATASELEETVISSAELARRRKEALKRIFGEESGNVSESEQGAAAKIAAQESQLLVMASEHEQLKSKLEDLQEKKEQMDQLLVQLKSLRPQALNNDGDSMSTSSMNVLEVASQATSATEDVRSETSQQAISDDKLRRLQEMRERLNQLRDLVQYYQASQEEERAAAGDAGAAAAAMPDHEPSLSSVNFEDPRLMSNLRLLQRGENIASRSGDGLNADEENDNEDEQDDDEDDASDSCTTEATENNDTNGETTTEDETESNQSSIMARWGDDPEIREKVKKLQSAKAKLRQLQDLVAMVQHTPEFAGSLPDDLAELAMSIDEEASDHQSNAAADNEALRAFTEETREAYYEVKMKQQKKELENLMQERQRLLQVQNQLKDLNENPTPRKTLSAGKKTTAVQAGNPLLEAAKLMEENKLATPTRDEIYAEMRRHKILQEELRQKRQELEELLSGTRSARINFDDLERAAFSVQSENDNDLFRVSMRSADITAAATWGSSTQEGSLQDEMENAEDEDFQGDGIVQVEEEEEEAQSEALSSDTYTIEAQYRQRQRQLPSLDRPSVSNPRWTLPQDSDSDAARHGIRYPRSPRYRSNTAPEHIGLTQSARKRQENIRSAEDLMADDPASTAEEMDYLAWKSLCLERQLSASMNMCHGLLRDQHSMNNLLQTSMSGNWGYPSQSPMQRNPYMNSPSNPMNDMLANYNMRLQHQQLMLNLNQTYGQLYALQEDIRNFEEMAKQEGSVNEENLPSSSYPYGPSPGMSSLGSMQSQYAQPHFPGMSYPPYGMNQYPPAYGLNASYTVPPNTSPAFNPYAASTSAYDPVNSMGNQRAPGARPQFNMNSVLNPQEHDEVPPNSELDDDQLGPSISNREPTFNLDLQSHLQPNLRPRTTGLFGSPATEDDSLTTPVATATKAKASSAVPPLNIDSLLKKMDRQRRRPESDTVTSTSSKGATKRGGGLMAKAREMAKDRSRQGASGGPRPGLSSSLSGTAFFDAASVTSTVSASSMPGELVNGEFFLPGERRRGTAKTQHEVESDVGSEFSLFEALRETIYSEVATLISQNETRPHYLIELFRELQMLNSDYLRQRALYALQDLVSKFLTDEAIGAASNVASTSQSVPPWQVPTASEHTPSESMITSEDDEMKARLYSQHPPKKSGSSVKSGEYDYMEHVESASTMSTPNSTHEFGFANDDLGDTVIHLDKALRRMREYERMKAEQEAASSAVSSNATGELRKKEGPQTSTDATSNSSAQDVGSESSFSSLPYPRIDTRQLDHQIKSIMQEVIPCLKEHIDDVCSSELLAYLRRLVLTLTRQRDDSQEFVRFFNKQLGSILQDSLAKFAGRKMRECGEDLLVDISEILFNELAFFRLMQDLDTSGSNLRTNAERASETGTDTATGVDEEEEGDSSSEESSDEEDTEAAEEEEEEDKGGDLSKASLETAMASYSKIEEEDLGKARDDEMAADLGISDQDDDSEEPSSKERVKIELSMSESKAIAYFGSGEDDNDVDAASIKAEETITSIGASNVIEDEHQLSQNDVQVEDDVEEEEKTVDVTAIQVDVTATELNDATTKLDATAAKLEVAAENINVAAETLDDAATKPDVAEATEPQAEGTAAAEQEEEQSTDAVATNSSLPNGDVEELAIEDLPPKLTSISQVELEKKMAEEQTNNNSNDAVLQSIVGMTSELAGDADALPEPSSAPIPNGMVHAGGDIGSE